MADKAAAPTAVASPAVPAQASATKKAAAAKAKKPRGKPTHPRTAEMVNAAIVALKERGGSSLQAIKKYIATTYTLDAEKHSSFIKKYLKTAVATGGLVQVKGKGASGSFKLAPTKTDAPKPKAKIVAKPKVAAPKKAAAPAAKKPAAKKPAAKKAAAATTEKKAAAKASAAKAPKAKAPSKVKKVGKAPTTKPKAPKPKKAAPAAAKAAKPAAKKAAPKKK